MAISFLFVQTSFNSQNSNEIRDRISSITYNDEDDSVNERLRYYSHAFKSISVNKIVYNICTQEGTIETCNNIFRDFTEINNKSIQNHIDTFILKTLNKEKRNIQTFLSWITVFYSFSINKYEI